VKAKTRVQQLCGAEHGRLVALSHRIHAHPEIAFEEERAAGWLCDALADRGFRVERGICGMPTAFRARSGNGPLHVAFCAEYD
jgi:metal-dependent amidase/aminoacylase/carboxypeptidase family protein